MKWLQIVALLIAFGIGSSCSESSNQRTQQQNTNKIAVRYAKCFTIVESTDHFLLEITNPDYQKSYHLKVSKKDFKNEQLVLLSASMVGRAVLLETHRSIIGVSDTSFLFDNKMKQLAAEGRITSFGEPGNFPIEKLIKIQPDIVMFSDFGNDFPRQKELEKLGIHVLPDLDWRETHPLGKAEWILVHGLLTNKLEEAKKIFERIETEYLQLKKTSADLKTTCLSGNLLGDIWWTPAGVSYHAKLFKDAGLHYVYQNSSGTGSISKSMEEILSECKQSQIWLNPGVKTKKEILKQVPLAKHLKSFKENSIYCYSHQMNYYWEMSAVSPHLILSDLISISQHKNENLFFYRKLN